MAKYLNVDNGKIGGPGKVVEIDEAKFGRRKYNRGRIIDGKWLFGGIERTEEKKIFLVPVEKRDSSTLLQVIQDKIEPGTTIISDCWKAYDCLSDEGFTHLTVNHSFNFVDPDIGAHTQNIERLWREVRSHVPRFGGIEKHFDGYLAEFHFKRAFPKHTTRYHHFFKAMGILYPPAYLERVCKSVNDILNVLQELDEEDDALLIQASTIEVSFAPPPVSYETDEDSAGEEDEGPKTIEKLNGAQLRAQGELVLRLRQESEELLRVGDESTSSASPQQSKTPDGPQRNKQRVVNTEKWKKGIFRESKDSKVAEKMHLSGPYSP
ncbi:hypothetical protein M8J75_010298 [Diaphorina citri]|nr:hypothetical protein M8J75_010298 [Diaphorina citri]